MISSGRPLLRIALAVLLLAACGAISDVAVDQSSARATVHSFYAALELRRVDDALGLLRTKDGAVLARDLHDRIAQAWDAGYRNGTIHIRAITFTHEAPLEDRARSLLPPGTEAVRLTFDIDGSTDSECNKLPARNVTTPAARLDGRWYLIEEVDFPLATVIQC